MAYTGKNPRFTSILLTDALSSTPSSPPSSAHKLIDRNGQLFLMDSNGVETPVGGGAGEKNYILSPSTAVSWVASSAAITVATDTTVVDLPRGLTTKTGILITGVSGSTAYARYRFTLDQADYNRKLKIKFDLKPVSGYVASDMKVDLYSNTASNYGGTSTRIATSSDSSSICAIPNMTGQFQTTVDMPGSTAPYMELRIGLNATTTQAIVISDVVVGPGLQPQGAVVGPWIAYTPTIGNVTTPASIVGYYRRVGDSMEITTKWTGAPSSSSSVTNSLPSGFTINTSAIAGGTGIAPSQALGTAQLNPNTGNIYALNVLYASTTTVKFVPMSNAADYYNSTVPVAANAGDGVTTSFTVPISEWSGSGVVNVVQNDVEYVSNSSSTDATDTTSFIYGPAGSTGVIATTALTAARAKRVQFQNPIQSTDTVILEYQPGGGTNPWIELTGIDTASDLGNYHVQNGASYGIKILRVSGSTTQLDIVFGQYAWSNSTYGAAGVAWTASLAATRWRVKKFSGGQAVGFGKATDGSLGLVNTYTDSISTTFTANGTGSPGTSSSKTIRIQRLGDWVTIHVPSFSLLAGTNTTKMTSNTALPTWARPLTEIQSGGALVQFLDNGAQIAVPALSWINTSGIITYQKTATESTVTNAGTTGTNVGHTHTYYVGTGS